MILWNVIMILTGSLLLLADFYAFVYKKFTEMMGLGWAAFSLFLIIVGVVQTLSGWTILIRNKEYLILYLIFLVMILGAFLVCMIVSQLAMKNQELAMQVSLLNQENERILKELERITGKTKTTL
ncbi:MAG: hypothetical protein ACERKN_00435 [Velocimicrobium sp.]